MQALLPRFGKVTTDSLRSRHLSGPPTHGDALRQAAVEEFQDPKLFKGLIDVLDKQDVHFHISSSADAILRDRKTEFDVPEGWNGDRAHLLRSDWHYPYLVVETLNGAGQRLRKPFIGVADSDWMSSWAKVLSNAVAMCIEDLSNKLQAKKKK